ncbi:BET1-like protein isoform X2 [Sorex araneus]|uniref:BET1-like protein isoform X2 n=1 Tax=Sorex araneus TaxID=42254 RepID=UPI002433C03E|nr:BET1-like protein isoform X2 [Sorex araneus]
MGVGARPVAAECVPQERPGARKNGARRCRCGGASEAASPAPGRPQGPAAGSRQARGGRGGSGSFGNAPRLRRRRAGAGAAAKAGARAGPNRGTMADWARAQNPGAVEEILDMENKRMTDNLASKVTRLKSYQFRIIAQNDVGLSETSPASEPVVCKDPFGKPSQPGELEILSISKDSITLQVGET